MYAKSDGRWTFDWSFVVPIGALLLLATATLVLQIVEVAQYSNETPSTTLPTTHKSLSQGVLYIVRHGEKGCLKPGESAANSPYHFAECLSIRGWARAYHLVSLVQSNIMEKPDHLYAFNYAENKQCKDKLGRTRTEQTVAPMSTYTGLSADTSHGSWPMLCVDTSDEAWSHLVPGSANYQIQYFTQQNPQWGDDEKSSCPSNSWTPPSFADVIAWYRKMHQYERIDGTCRPYKTPCCNYAAASAMKKHVMAGHVVLAVWEHYNIPLLEQALGIPSGIIPAWSDSDFDSIHVITIEKDGILKLKHKHQKMNINNPL